VVASCKDESVAGSAATAHYVVPGTPAAPQSISCRFNSPNDSDWFRIDLLAGKTYTFETFSGDSDSCTLGICLWQDPRLALSADGVQVIASADEGAGRQNDAKLVYTAPADGAVYLIAFDDEGRTGDYTLKFSVAE